MDVMQKVEPQFRPDPRPNRVRPPTNTPPRRSRATAGPARLTGPALTWIAVAVAAPFAFIIALWLTSPTPAPGVAALINATVSDSASVMAAVHTAGLRGTPDVRGAIEEIRRLDSERVMIRGWATDATSSGTTLTVVAFAGRAHMLTPANDTITAVARLVGLSGGDAATTSFRGTFACTRGEKLVVVAVSADRRYSQFRSLVCP